MRQNKKSDPATYTKPELRDRVKAKVVAGDKGGDPGQWSARKAQLVTQAYEKQGGGYKKPRNQAQKSLEHWGEEKWTTSDKKKARRKGGTTRYLPEKAWDRLSAQEKAGTNQEKKRGSREGKQFVANTPAAEAARKKASKQTGTAKKKTVAASKRKSAAKKSTVASKKLAAKKSTKRA